MKDEGAEDGECLCCDLPWEVLLNIEAWVIFFSKTLVSLWLVVVIVVVVVVVVRCGGR